MLNRTETIAEFIARKGVTRCAPAGEDTPRTPVRKFKATKAEAEATPARERTPVYFNVADYVDVIVGTAHKVAPGQNAEDIANQAVAECIVKVRDGKFYGGNASAWCATITANLAKNEAKRACNRGHSEANVSGERGGDDGDVAVSGVVLPAAVEELRAVRAVEASRIEAFIATLDSDVATYVRERIATGSNNEACAAVGWNAVRGSRVWKEFQTSAERAVGMAELAPLAHKG